MNNKALLDKCRAYFTVALILTIAVASLLEIVAYFIFVGVGKCQLSFSDSYLKYNVGLPILLNCCIFLLVVLLNAFSKFSHDIKNDIIVHGASAISLVISIFHREFIVTSIVLNISSKNARWISFVFPSHRHSRNKSFCRFYNSDW